ncbi:MAG: hypothetical protein AAF415_18305 [Pseudomonadota bacterium]
MVRRDGLRQRMERIGLPTPLGALAEETLLIFDARDLRRRQKVVLG